MSLVLKNEGVEMLSFILLVVFILVQCTVFFIAFYHGIIAVFGLLPIEEDETLKKPQKRFAIVVAAHNEEKVVKGVIDSLYKMDYPKELFDIMVICDNCTDDTAKIVRENNAEAYERSDNKKRGKGYALAWMFDKIYKMDTAYDAIVVLDADNIVSKNFLSYMNDRLCKGHKIMQGYLDTKNPDDSWITLSYAISYWYMARIWQLSRYRLGLANALGGTGMCFEIETLKKLRWDATSLTEDLEFTMKAVLNDIRPIWVHQAKVYDEKPLTFEASWYQRLRWMQGHWDVAFRYTKPLLKKFVVDRDLRAFDSVLYLFQAPRIIITYLILLINMVLFLSPAAPIIPGISFDSVLPFYITTILFISQWLFPPVIAIVMVLEKAKLKRLLGLLWFQLYGISWLPLTLIGFFTRDNKEWSHTLHSREITIEEIELQS